MTVMVLACFVFWIVAQNAEKPPPRSNAEVLIKQLNDLSTADKYQEVLHFSDSIVRIFEKNGSRADWLAALRIRTIAQKDHEEARTALIQLLPLVQAQTLDDSITAKLNGLLGFACLNADEIDQGIWHYERCLSGLLRHQCKIGVGGAYMNLGFALKQQGDYRAARQYYLAAMPLLQKEGYSWNVSEAFINLGDISRYLAEYEAAREYYHNAAIAIPDQPELLSSNLGWSYADEGRYREALTHFQKSCTQAPCDAEQARIMGRCAEMLGDTTAANLQFRLAFEKAETLRDSGIARAYLGQALLLRNQPESALQALQQALHYLFPDLRADHLEDNPRSLSADFWPVEILRHKAQAFRGRYTNKGAIQNLHQAWSAISTAVTALDTLRLGMRNEISGQDAVDYAYSTYETGIQVALDLERAEPGRGHISSAYELAEHAKSNVLKTNLQEKDLRRNSQLPDSLLWQEKTALSAVAFWEEADRPDSLLAAVRRLEKVQSTIEKQIPLLAKAHQQTQNIPIATIQDALAERELLLQYFWGDSTVIAFAVGKRSLNTLSIPRTPALSQSIDSLRVALLDWRLPPEAYSARAAPVYQQFCAPLLQSAGKLQRLIVVPDGPLWKVPFEALTHPDGRFLVQDCALSYHWSGALWLQAHKQSHRSKAIAEYGGFAPQYPAPSGPMASLGKGLGDLPEARAAVAAAASAWGGKVWQGPNVDKGLFQQEAGKYGILHLAMHGLLDLKDRTRTGLAFPNSGDSIDLLNTLEISQMDLSAQLAVLSACNTGSGVVFRGEGVMSLSRAFALAGCPALTANLWEVPSRETNDITAAFLSLLKKGTSKDEALRSAKLDFLNRAETERRHPFFWAGQVLIGNEAPIGQSRFWVWVLALACFVGSSGWLIWRHFKRRR